MSTQLAPQIELSAVDPCKKDLFFSNSELDKLENRELPPVANPAASCTFNLFFGFFFDGTRNNYKLCQQNEGYSNVARLYDCYPGQVVPRVIGDEKNMAGISALLPGVCVGRGRAVRAGKRREAGVVRGKQGF